VTDGISRRWQTSWWGLLAALFAIGIGMSAGFWQLGRADEMRALRARFAGSNRANTLPRLVRDDESSLLRYEVLQLNGNYDPDHQVLLDGMSYGGRPGYQVLTPLITAEGEVLVNRGWIPANGNRVILPDVRVSGAPREVFGRIERLPSPGLRLATPAPDPDAPWPRRLLFPTSAEIGTQIGTVLREYQLLLDPADPDGYVRDWRPGGMDPVRHLGYAVQWFGLSLTVIVIYCVLTFRNRKNLS